LEWADEACPLAVHDRLEDLGRDRYSTASGIRCEVLRTERESLVLDTSLRRPLRSEPDESRQHRIVHALLLRDAFQRRL